MKSIKLFFVLLMLLSSASIKAARLKIPIGTTQKVSEVYKLPDDECFKTEDGEHVNLGIVYEVFSIFWIPLFVTEDPCFILTIEGKDDSFYNIDADALGAIEREYDLNDFESLKQVPFWDAWGGKLLILVLIILFFTWAYVTTGDDDDKNTGKDNNLIHSTMS